MQFKDLQQNSTIFILDKAALSVKKGKVLSKGLPHMVGTPTMVIDIKIDSDGKTALYQFPETSSLSYSGDLVIATDPSLLVSEVEVMKASAEDVLASIDRQKEIVEKTDILLAELNPLFKERRATEERFGKIESSISGLAAAIEKLVNGLK